MIGHFPIEYSKEGAKGEDNYRFPEIYPTRTSAYGVGSGYAAASARAICLDTSKVSCPPRDTRHFGRLA
jgi:hypothetical protein